MQCNDMVVKVPGRMCDSGLWSVLCGAEEEYLHRQAVIGHRHAGVAVPAHMHGGVGAVVCLLV